MLFDSKEKPWTDRLNNLFSTHLYYQDIIEASEPGRGQDLTVRCQGSRNKNVLAIAFICPIWIE